MENKNRLIESDDLGNWGIKGLLWKNLYEGEVITREIHEKLYGCLAKLKDYEETELSPEEVEDGLLYIRLAKRHGTIGLVIDECIQYEEIGTVEEFRRLKAKDTPKAALITGHRAVEIIEQLAKEYSANGWIPCSERLPEGNDDVMVIYTDNDGEVDICCLDWFLAYSDTMLAWMPLPEPYKPQKEAEWKDHVMKHFTKVE